MSDNRNPQDEIPSTPPEKEERSRSFAGVILGVIIIALVLYFIWR